MRRTSAATSTWAASERYERARESLDVVRSLWDSWATDAFVQDKSTGQYLDPARVRLTNHRGKHFKVKGPLNVARTPQGQPVVFMAGQSDAGKELAAYGGEALFGTASNKEEAQNEYADIKGRMPKYGRPPEALRILPALSVYVGRTAAEADALYEELQSLISPALAVSYLSKVVGFDVTDAPLDGPMPRASGESLGGTAIGRSVLDMAARDELSVRDTYERVLPSMGGNMVKGTRARSPTSWRIGTPARPATASCSPCRSSRAACATSSSWWCRSCSAAACVRPTTEARPCATTWASPRRRTRSWSLYDNAEALGVTATPVARQGCVLEVGNMPCAVGPSLRSRHWSGAPQG